MTLDGNAVRSVDRAAALLLALGDCPGEAGVTELARRLGLHKSTASRLLATLEKRGLVEQDGDSGKYRLGLVVIRLAERAERTLDLRSIAMPELDRLARSTRETTSSSPSPRPTARTSWRCPTGPAAAYRSIPRLPARSCSPRCRSARSCGS
jgi:DNA-binding transcriptional ArsR family regulator